MWYDLVVLAILVLFTIRGAAKGMVWQLAGIAGIVVCFLFADGISAFAGPYVALEPPLNHWVILLAAYVLFTFVAYLIAGQISEVLDKVKLREFDRHLGAIFGFVKGIVLCLFLTFMVVTVSKDARGALLQSRSGYAAAKIVDTVHPYLPILPDNLRLALEEYIHLLDDPGFDLQHSHDHDHLPGSSSDDHDGHSSSNLTASQLESLWSDLTKLVSQPTSQTINEAINQESDPDVKSELINAIVKVLQSATPENRQKIEQHFQLLGNQDPSKLLSYLASELEIPISSSTDVVPQLGEPSPAVPSDSISDLAQNISKAYETVPAKRQSYEKKIVGFLSSLPQAVQLGVLQDWNADIWALPDPDRQTNAQSTLEQRIVRQLQKAGIEIWQLEKSMQDHLRAAGMDVDGSLR